VEKPTRSQFARYVALACAIGLALLIAGCGGGALALRTGYLPAVDWQIETGAFHYLLIHNGPTEICERRLRDGCALRTAQHEFYIHYVTPTGDRQLIWFRTSDS